MTYLDYNATAPLMPEVVAAMQEGWAHPYNPSSVHAHGRKARQLLEDSRRILADAIGAWPDEVIFTSSGSEANNTALRAVDRPLLVGASEHSSVLETARRLGGDIVPVDANGLIDQEILASKLHHLGRPALVSVMLANNETGVIQPVADISRIVHEHNGLLHCDAVQALGKLTFDMCMLGADMLTLCAHKCGGPVGIGVLVVRQDLPIKPFITGGGQELNRRAGTQAVALALGFAKVVESSAGRAWLGPVETAKQEMERRIIDAAGGEAIVGGQSKRLGNTASIIMPGVQSETQLMHCDLEGFAISAGSACSSGRIEPSHVLRAMGHSEDDAQCAIRVSAGWNTSPEELSRFTDCWLTLYRRLAQKAA